MDIPVSSWQKKVIIVTFEMKVIDYTTFKAFHYSDGINAQSFLFF